MIGLDINAIAKLAFMLIINPKVVLHSEPNIKFDLLYFRFLISNESVIFNFFIQIRKKKTYMHTNITYISSF